MRLSAVTCWRRSRCCTCPAPTATQGVPAATPGPTIDVPDSTVIGAGKVASGFPHTPEGAIGQLAAIEVAVLTEMSIPRTNEIYQAWAADGAAPVDQWRLTWHVQAFLAAANMGQTLGLRGPGRGHTGRRRR